MKPSTRDAALRVANLVSQRLDEIRDQLDSDDALGNLQPNIIVAALVWNLCCAVMNDGFWKQRGDLYTAFDTLQIEDVETVRHRLDELLDGLKIRSDFWNHN